MTINACAASHTVVLETGLARRAEDAIARRTRWRPCWLPPRWSSSPPWRFWCTGREEAARRRTPAANRRVMLAMLPFENLSGDPEQGYISDGLTEEMIAELGRLDPARLGVIARTSVMTYRSTTKSVAEIARELGVDFVLEGSVRREGDRVRIVAQLIRASDQTHVWAERYDRDVRSILSLQGEVARAIARQTRSTLSAGATSRPRDLERASEAYQAYLKGRFFLNRRTADAIQKALEHFQRAVAIEPSYAQAYAGLADAHELMASYASAAAHESLERGMAAAQRAIELEPQLSEAYAALGTMHANYRWNWKEAERAIRTRAGSESQQRSSAQGIRRAAVVSRPP